MTSLTSPPASHPKPFIKWVGGKRQLLPAITENLPEGIGSTYTSYVEPFLGGGAVLLHMLSAYSFDRVVVGDMNKELINTYLAVQQEVEALKQALEALDGAYKALEGDQRKEFYLTHRTLYNERIASFRGKQVDVEIASLFIFLNRTCFNGLYRVNKQGSFNVPFGAHANPLICDSENLDAVHEALQPVEFYVGPYQDSSRFLSPDTFLYVDPPYRPLSNTAAFVSYTSAPFNDTHQQELAQFLRDAGDKGIAFMMSNSDPKNTDKDDSFFDELYDWANIQRVNATRNINRDGSKRGAITELLIKNY